MRVLIAPDKFKGSLTAAEAAEAMERGVKRALPRTACAIIPVSDGGEGLIEVALSSSRRGRRSGGDDAYANYDADLRVTRVRGPLGEDHDARWVLMKPSHPSVSHSRRMDEFTERSDGYDGKEGHDSIAVIEMAEASGLAWITPGPDESLRADSYGTGQLIRAAVDAGATTIICGIGGSACTDGGSGALRALGARILDADGNDVASGGKGLCDVQAIDTSDLMPSLRLDHSDSDTRQARIIIATDVSNPLLGSDGAAAVYAPQKGADPREIDALEKGLSQWAACLSSLNADIDPAKEGMGAAGGFSSGLTALCSAVTVPGFDAVAQLNGFDDALEAGADLLIVGEGSLDKQTLSGKVPVAAARRAGASGIPAVAVAGAVNAQKDELANAGISDVIGLAEVSDRAGDKDDTIQHAAEYVERATEKLVRRFQAGHTHPV
ncbi:glycerate kinase [Corynebacterium parakroppenstedtii]|uniref:glycerate kinase n=1 Tax=Corynebacterium parakroppenstedtii TaxID=2828363 RepID=UPI001C8F4767|nr:glycerate kinase [Corynebacterium parakroppenstedtii]MBY0794380.1 glycerate kinase [Corynebacterium parakroppenstedtii]